MISVNMNSDNTFSNNHDEILFSMQTLISSSKKVFLREGSFGLRCISIDQAYQSNLQRAEM
jgi:hypothetical protein